jgi:hypothetical protein
MTPKPISPPKTAALILALLPALLAAAATTTAYAQTPRPAKSATKPAPKEIVTPASALADALAEAQAIADPSQKTTALSKLVDVQLKSGDLAGALQTASSLPNSDVRAHALAQVAFAHAAAGDIAAADAIADLVMRGNATGLSVTLSTRQQRDYRDTVLKAIAAAQADRGDVAGARATAAKGTTSGDIANEYMRLIAKAQAKSGDAAAAEKTFAAYIHSMPDSGAATDTANQSLELLAAAQLEYGDIAAAQATASRIRNEASQSTVLSKIAVALAEQNQGDAAAKSLAQAVAAARAYRDIYGYDKSRAFLEIVKAQIAIKDVHAALDTARQISDGFTKNQAYALIAVAQAKSGDAADAVQTVNSIVNDAAAKNREDTLQDIAIAQADADNIAAAQATLALLPNDYDTSGITAAIAVAQARAGDFKDALATSDLLSQNDRRAWSFRLFAVRGIAKAQAEKGEAAAAKAWIASLNTPSLEASALTGIAEGLVAKNTTNNSPSQQ